MRTHGLTGTDEHRILRDIKARCLNPARNNFHSYGGRGIKVCDRWLHGDGFRSGVECFVADVGNRPSKAHSIERRNIDGNYEPSNCYWATSKEQSRNRRNTRTVLAGGRVISLIEAIEASGSETHREVVASRLSRGWSLADALKPPTYRKSEETRRKMSEAARRRHAAVSP